ncbi:hypothetical protein SESBI_37352 [Sesbania bispinosa]|nr:hypothetical protein SESBI_37352 [Sesbania bispinosa]
MDGPFDMISAIHPGKDSWRLRVRVVCLWEMCSIAEPTKPFAIDMVLMDIEGGKIQASIRKPMMKKFRNLIAEGEVYTVLSFAMIKNVGSYRASRHDYKLLFSAKTKVYPSQCDVIPVVGLSLMSSEQISKTNGESNFLFDFMGILTVVSAEKEVETDGRKTRMMEIELADDKGRMRCTVFGNYVDTLKEYVASGVAPLHVVVVQLFKVRLYRGNVVLQNVNNTSRILWNPDIPEAIDFRNSLACHGIDSDVEIGVIEGGNRVVPLSDEFLRLYPRKYVNELQITEEGGIFIVDATIVFVMNEEQWWYGACKCHKAVTLDGGLYYCSNCSTHVVEVTPRYKLRVEVFRWDDSASFILFDSDCVYLLGKTCKELLRGLKAGEHPPDFRGLIGKDLLFKVEKTIEYAFSYDDSFKVKKVCDDKEIIQLFKKSSNIETPLKSKFQPPFPKLGVEENSENPNEGMSDSLEAIGDVSLNSAGFTNASSSSSVQMSLRSSSSVQCFIPSSSSEQCSNPRNDDEADEDTPLSYKRARLRPIKLEED